MTDPADRPEPPTDVTVTPDGPYVVHNGLPVQRRHQVTSKHGEPMTWSAPDELPVAPTYALCRCGASANKPFCDGSHQRIGFDGSEAAPHDTYEQRSRAYPGSGVVVRDDRSICEHAGFCANRLSNVWKMVHRSDDTVVRAQMLSMIEHCPSGALTYRVEGEAADGEPDLAPAVNVVADGPLWITGSARVQRSDGSVLQTRPRVTLCRCGASKNKPYCDGSHTTSGFRDG